MSVHLRRYPEYRLELGVLCGSVAGDEMVRLFESFDKCAKWLLVFNEDVGLSGLDIAHIPAMKRAVTPDEAEPHAGGPGLTAIVNLGGGGEFFARFWTHYASQGVRRSRKRELFPAIAPACQWLDLPPPASETLNAAVADAVPTEAATTAAQAEQAESRRRIVKAASRLAPGEIPYHVVLSGSAVLDDPGGGPPTLLAEGDILLLPGGSRHVLHCVDGAPPAPAHERAALNLVLSENAGQGERLDLLCGRFVLSAPHNRLLRAYLPTHFVVRTGPGKGSPEAPSTGGQLAGLVDLMRMEAAEDRLGGNVMLGALSTALFALALRLASEGDDAPAGLLALAGRSRLAPAVAAMVSNPAHPWSLPELARLCNMSRATLARHFQETLGRSASDLLTDIRMTLAANVLRNSSASTGAVAEAVGYQSEAAFQRAFKHHMGVTPARWRREVRAAASSSGENGSLAPAAILRRSGEG